MTAAVRVARKRICAGRRVDRCLRRCRRLPRRRGRSPSCPRLRPRPAWSTRRPVRRASNANCLATCRCHWRRWPLASDGRHSPSADWARSCSGTLPRGSSPANRVRPARHDGPSRRVCQGRQHPGRGARFTLCPGAVTLLDLQTGKARRVPRAQGAGELPRAEHRWEATRGRLRRWCRVCLCVSMRRSCRHAQGSRLAGPVGVLQLRRQVSGHRRRRREAPDLGHRGTWQPDATPPRSAARSATRRFAAHRSPRRAPPAHVRA